MTRTKSRKHEVPVKSKLKKDPGVPKLPDLKVKVHSAQRAHQNLHAKQSNVDAVMASEPTLTTLAALAEESASRQGVDDPSSSTSAQPGKTKEQLRRHYLRTLHKVIDESDIVILVLDARDPEGCRSRLVEEEVRRREGEGKKLVFVLTKIDLIPRSNAEAWLRYLRHTTPTLPFKSPPSAQNQRSNISSPTAPSLMRLLKAYKPRTGSVTVGVVGYPNVGKSSLINSLKRSKACAVAAQPGHTKEIQSVQLERGLRIVDSPGVVFDDDDFDDGKGSKKGNVLLRNVVKVEDIEDPNAVVEEILSRTPRETVQKLYKLPEFSSTLEFLTMLALTTGKLLKGGTPDVSAAARHVLMDWNHQKIPYFSTPPTTHPSSIPSVVKTSKTSDTIVAPGAENVGQAQIVSQFSQPFTLEGLFGAADAGAFGRTPADVQMEADEDKDPFYTTQEAMQEDGKEMISDDLAPHIPRKRSRSPATDVQSNQTMDYGYVRQPKRQRKSKDVPSYEAPPDEHVLKQMAKSNPLNRRALKKEAKRLRKAHRTKTSGGGGGMDVDEESLEFTFMAP
ncbi:P-loop containing nucleoside triphosphate hydrolase protein [Amanita muscaria]